MTTLQAEIPAFPYLSGKEFTEKLRNVTGTTTNYQLADKFGIPRSTIQTWHSHERTAFELIVRAHLATGASVKYLALGEGEPFEEAHDPTEALHIQRLSNGELEEAGKITIDVVTLNNYHLKHSTTKVIDSDGDLHFVNTEQTHATSGSYLISIDGSLSINPIQRLPGKKLAVGFSGSTIDISEDDIEVLGRVAMEMKKK